MITETKHGAYSIAVTSDGKGLAAIVKGGKIGPLFICKMDAYDWAEDTELGACVPLGYDVKPLRGDAARLALAVIAHARKGGAL